MIDTETQQKLTAILYADVVAYSRLTGQDEVGTHRRVMKVLDYASDLITQCNGSVLRYAGDAILAEFSSVSKLVKTAVQIQNELAKENSGLPGNERVEIRIGVNIGEVIQDRGEIFGHGVNLAARLESVAKPGGICISAAVQEQISGKLDITFTDGGKECFKNISHPVHVYHWLPDGKSETTSPQVDNLTRSSIAVLAFENMSGDPEQVYFSDGITEDIITELSHFKDIAVTARNSSFAFRDQSFDIVEIGRKLNVQYVLEGSIRRSGQRVRVTAQLIDASTGTHVWADKYDRDLKDVFAVQDEVVRVIATTLIGKLRHADHEIARRKPPSSLAAYDCVVLGLNHFYKWTPEDNSKALALFNQAISIDPEYACAYAWLAQAHFREGLNIWSASYEQSFSLTYEYATKAVTLDDNDSLSHTAMGIAYLFRGEHELARAHFGRALTLNPSNTDAMVHMARCEALTGDPDKGMARLSEALQYNPLANYQWFVGQIEYISERYDVAVKALMSLSSPNALVHAFLAASYGQLGNLSEAKDEASRFVTAATELLKSANAKVPESWVEFVVARYPFQHEEDAARLRVGLTSAGLR
jgi:adenylate cyclase